MYDVIVVGARCGGSPTAMLLARKGYRVLVVDRASFPSDTMSTHYVMAPGVVRLQRWGLLDQVVASNCPPVRHHTVDVGPFALTGSAPPLEGVGEQYAPRRTVLDKILVDAAAGVELRERFVVRELVWDDGRVTGVRGGERDDAHVTERARLVVGADGQHSLVARAVGAPTYRERPSLTCTYYTYWSGVPIEGPEIYLRDRRWMAILPTNDDLVCLPVQWPAAQAKELRSDIEGNYLQTLQLAPHLAERVHAGKREAHFLGTADLPNYFRKPYGPGWALVGDAGYHKDPNLAQGISDAFRDAEYLADAIDAGFSGRRPIEEAMADYERQRNEAAMPGYELDCQFASLEPPPPEIQQLFAALYGNQEETDRFLGTIFETVPIPEFFAPQNVRRIIQAAA
ncbi:MAG: NAD(P)/FAD-dependent oxidoreductase [Actinomycetota bacterium]